MNRIRCIVVALLLFPSSSIAQEAIKARPSPLAITTGRYKDTYLKIIYSQPHKRGREIFGVTIPYGAVWRTGANEATELTITKDIIINKQPLKAGTYSIFTIPEKEKWTIIINSDLGMWGAYNYNQKIDVMRFEVPVEILDRIVYEPFTILIDQKTDQATISMMWDRIKVSIPIQFNDPR